jgi:O-antigen/teichoic acid export membrane protein
MKGPAGPWITTEWIRFAVVMADQALMSGLSLFIGALFIARAPKEEYGVYALVVALVLLLNGVQNALVCTPLTANGARLQGEEQGAFIDRMFGLQTSLALVLAGLTGVGIWMWERGSGHAETEALARATAVAVMGAWMREFRRTENFLRLQVWKALFGDVAYLVLACTGLLLVGAHTGTMRASWALAVVGVAGVVTGLRTFHGSQVRAPMLPTLRLIGGQGRWTLPGVVVTWAQSTAYSYLVALIVGSTAVADLSASRLFLTPPSFAVAAWSRLFIPRAGRLIAVGGDQAVWRLARRGAAELLVLTLAYVTLLAVFFSLGGVRLLPTKYAGAGTLVAAWAIYFLVNILRGVASTALAAHTAFRSLFVLSLWTALLSVPIMILGLRAVGTVGVIMGMLITEALLACLVWRDLWKRTFRETAAPVGAG